MAMFYPQEMCKVRIFTRKENKKKIVEKLYSLKVLHIRKYTGDNKFIQNALPLQDFEDISKMFLNISSALAKLKEEGIEIHPHTSKGIKDEKIKEIYKDFMKNVYDKLERVKKIEEEVSILKARLEKMKILKLLDIKDIDHIYKLKLVTPFIFATKDDEKVEDILKSLAEKKEVIYYKSSPKVDGERYFIVLITPQNENVVDKLTSFTTKTYSIDEFKVIAEASAPTTSKTNVNAIVKYLENELNKKVRELTITKEGIKEYVKRNESTLGEMYYSLKREVDKHEKVMQFGESKTIFYIEGYIPCTEREKIVQAIREADRYAIIEIKKAEEEAPTYLPHPKTISPFKFFLDIYSLPKYNSIDPTFFTTITFPLFYGFMLGDIGYGLVLLLFSILVVRHTRKRSVFNYLGKIMIFASLSSIIFGAVFGEFFGAETIFGITLHPLLHRTHEIMDLIIISIVVGVFHVNLGLLIGFFHEMKHRHYKEAILEKLSWIILEGGVVYLAFAYFLKKTLIEPQIDKILSVLIMISAIYMLWKGEGAKGIFEIPGIFGNILSYARLGAIGLSSAALAFVVNKFAFPLFQKSPLYWIGGIAILIVGHTFNIALGVIGPFLHSLRLHYVEFFTKFYEQGGEEYKPYGKEEEKIEIKEHNKS